MTDPTSTDALPTPEQMRNYFAAANSARQARRIQEASRAIFTGNIAAAACLFETVLVIVHAGWLNSDNGSGDTGKMLLLDLVIFGFLAWSILSLRWLKRQRSRSSVYVLGRAEAEMQKGASSPILARGVVFYIGWIMFSVLGTAIWMIAFRHLSNSAIVAALSVGPMIATGYFVCRFAIFLFWEDLLFAVAVAVAWLPFLFQAWHLASLCLVTFPMVIVGTICLHFRWVRWRRLFALQSAESSSEEVDS